MLRSLVAGVRGTYDKLEFETYDTNDLFFDEKPQKKSKKKKKTETQNMVLQCSMERKSHLVIL